MLVCSCMANAQENLGINLSNYATTNTLELNPASIVDSKVYLDINLAGFNAFGHNDHAFFPAEGTNLFSAISGELPMSLQRTDSVFKSGVIDASIDGPGGVLTIGRSSFGITTANRTHVDVIHMPFELAQLIYRNFRHSPYYDRTFSLKDMEVNYLNWHEIRFSAGYMLHVTKEHHLNGALSIKKLIANSHVGMRVEETDYQFTSSNLFINDFIGDIATAAPGSKGGGWAADMGLVFKRVIQGRKNYVPYSTQSRCVRLDYKYKIGLSLLDMGAVTFRQGAENTRVTNSAIFWPDFHDTQMSGIQGLDSIIDLRFENDQTSFENTASYSVSLPRAFSVQADVHLQDYFFIGGALVHNVKSSRLHSLRRSNIVGIVPRYETQNFEFSLPVSVHEYKRLQAGMAFRWKFVILGTDNILPMFFTDVYGMDMYFDIKIPIFGNGSCGNPKAGLKRRGMVAPCWGG